MEIEFRDPPAVRSTRQVNWGERLRPLMDHPGRWAMVVTKPSRGGAYTVASQLKRRVMASFDLPGRWEFMVDGKTYEVFARYLGPESEVSA